MAVPRGLISLYKNGKWKLQFLNIKTQLKKTELKNSTKFD
jgi:hypothetical protein